MTNIIKKIGEVQLKNLADCSDEDSEWDDCNCWVDSDEYLVRANKGDYYIGCFSSSHFKDGVYYDFENENITINEFLNERQFDETEENSVQFFGFNYDNEETISLNDIDFLIPISELDNLFNLKKL